MRFEEWSLALLLALVTVLLAFYIINAVFGILLEVLRWLK